MRVTTVVMSATSHQTLRMYAQKRMDTPMGRLLIRASSEGIQAIDWVDLQTARPEAGEAGGGGVGAAGVGEVGEVGEALDLRRRASTWVAQCVDELAEYFTGARIRFDVPVVLVGTAFQTRVWSALAEIPYGETRSYQAIARRIGAGQAVRAVGQANRRNPVAIVIPCHRVIGSNGAMVGYAGSHTGLKERLLEHEGVHPQGYFAAQSVLDV